MFHKHRTWNVVAVDSDTDLMQQLHGKNWTLCAGFQVASHPAYYFLNDSISEDGAQEYAIVKEVEPGKFVQIESVTIGWCDFRSVRNYVRDALSGKWDDSPYNNDVHPAIERGKHRCPACA